MVIPASAKAIAAGLHVDLEEAHALERGDQPSPTCLFHLTRECALEGTSFLPAPTHVRHVLPTRHLMIAGPGCTLQSVLSFHMSAWSAEEVQFAPSVSPSVQLVGLLLLTSLAPPLLRRYRTLCWFIWRPCSIGGRMHNKRRKFCMRGKLCHECEQAFVCFVFFFARCFQSRRHSRTKPLTCTDSFPSLTQENKCLSIVSYRTMREPHSYSFTSALSSRFTQHRITPPDLHRRGRRRSKRRLRGSMPVLAMSQARRQATRECPRRAASLSCVLGMHFRSFSCLRFAQSSGL